MRPRPLVDLDLQLPPDDVLLRFRDALGADDCPCVGHVGTIELSLGIRPPKRRVWSPWISLEVRPADAGTSLRGRIGPQPQLWTAFVMLYAALVFAFLMGTSFGYVQWTMGESPSGALVALGALAGLAVSCGLDLTGRRLGRPQMVELRDFIDRVARP